MDGEERERHALAEQIERAKAQEAVRLAEAAKVDTDLVKKEGEKITLSFAPIGVKSEAGAGAGPSVKAEPGEEAAGAAAGPSTSTSLSFGGARSGFGTGADIKPLSIANPLKRPAPVNVFKAAKVAKVKTEAEDGDRDRDRDGSVAGTQMGSGGGARKYTSEAERLMREDQARKGGRGGNGSGGGGGGYGGIGPVRTNKPNLGRTY